MRKPIPVPNVRPFQKDTLSFTWQIPWTRRCLFNMALFAWWNQYQVSLFLLAKMFRGKQPMMMTTMASAIALSLWGCVKVTQEQSFSNSFYGNKFILSSACGICPGRPVPILMSCSSHFLGKGDVVCHVINFANFDWLSADAKKDK